MGTTSKKVKMDPRTRTKFRIRKRITGSNERPRISVFRSSKQTYAQLVSDESGVTIASASTRENEVQQLVRALSSKSASDSKSASEPGLKTSSSKSVLAARAVGIILAKRGATHNISRAVFDRNGFSYIGRVKAVAEGIREGGIKV